MTLIMELVDLLKLLQDQLEKKTKLDHNLLVNFVDPVWNSFIAVHNDYLVSFGKYIEMLQDGKPSNKLIAEKIHQDSISSSNIRSDLFNLIDAMDSRLSKKFMERHELIMFLWTIKSYFSLQEYIPYSVTKLNENEWILLTGQPAYEPWEVSYRSPAQEEFWKLIKDEKSQKAIGIIYHKMPMNGKAKIKVIPDKRISISHDKHEITFSIDGKILTNKIGGKDDALLIEWGEKIISLMAEPAANFPRAIMLSALVLNKKTSKNDLVDFMKHILSMLQERYDEVSKDYYRLKIKLLA